MKIGVIVPDRQDRPRLLQNCKRMISSQLLKPEEILIVDNDFLKSQGINHDPSKKDITLRYRVGYDYFRGKGFDLLAFKENDDWYSDQYLSIMANEWKKNNRPDIIGTNYTIYYQIELKRHMIMHHNTRSSAMSTLIKPDLDIKWCKDDEPYTDIHLWNFIKNRKTFDPGKHICMGIKHGEGLCGGNYHKDRLERYSFPDESMSFLKLHLDQESFNFYSTYFDRRSA